MTLFRRLLKLIIILSMSIPIILGLTLSTNEIFRPLAFIQWPIVITILYLSFSSNYRYIWLSPIIGFVWDVGASLPFGMHMVSLSIAVIAAMWILYYFFTNQTSFMVGAAATLSVFLFHLIMALMGAAYRLSDIFDRQYIFYGFVQAIVSGIGVIVIHYLGVALIKKYRPDYVDISDRQIFL